MLRGDRRRGSLLFAAAKILLVAISCHAQNYQAERADAIRRAQILAAYVPVDPWRIVDGEVEYAKGGEWVQFTGRVLEVQPGRGIRVEGSYGQPGSYDLISREGEFFVANFSHTVVEDSRIDSGDRMSALLDGTYTYTTVMGGSRTIRKLDYCQVSTNPPPVKPITSEEIDRARKAAARRDQAKLDREKSALEYNRQLADKGDPYGQLRMGERYLQGDGVEKDPAKARDYFAKAAAQGNEAAKKALEKNFQP